MIDVSSILANLIAESYRRKPVLTIIGIFFTISIIVVGVFTASYFENQNLLRTAPKDIEDQMQELDKLDEGLKKLSAFIAVQKSQLSEKQAVIKQLEEKRSMLEPIVNTQSEIVDALFKVYEQRAQKNKWFDLGLGFVLGIIGSLIASVIFKLINKSRENA